VTAKKPVLYQTNQDHERPSKKGFVKNKLSPSLFSLSPLFKLHLSFLQQTIVRPTFSRSMKNQSELE